MNVIPQRRRIFLRWCSFKVYTVILFWQSLYGVVMQSLYYKLQLDLPTNAAIGPSPVQKRAATSKNHTTCTLPGDVISHNLIHNCYGR